MLYLGPGPDQSLSHDDDSYYLQRNGRNSYYPGTRVTTVPGYHARSGAPRHSGCHDGLHLMRLTQAVTVIQIVIPARGIGP
eukprot:2234023-Rhodomonas_salina.1